MINATEEEEIRVAIVEDGVLQEFDIQSAAKEQLKGNIYKAKVVNLEQGLQAAFVDFSGGKPGFLSIGEVQPQYWPEKASGGRRRIQNVLQRGQEILVQVTKDQIGTKGAALTTYVSLPGRYLVLMPGSDSMGISRKIEDEQKRKRIKEILGQLDVPPEIGIIVRTAGLDRSKSEIAKDFAYLKKLWEGIVSKAESLSAPALVYQDLDVIIRAIRDYFSADTSEVMIDDPDVYRQAKAFFADVMPRYTHKVKLYAEGKPLFTKHELEKQIETIYKRKLALKGGGSIVIEPTEAMVTIDVNSGRGVPGKGIEETAYQTNLEAAGEIARQLRLRDLGGLVVIDFIDMKDRKHKTTVEREFKAAVKRDKARIQAGPISRFGIMELSRQRMRSPIWDVSFKPCLHCHGQGVVKSTEALSMTILRAIHEAAARGNVREVRGIMSTAVAEYLLNRKRREMLKIETDYDVKVTLVGTSEILESDYDLEFVTRELARPPQERQEKAEKPEKPDKPGRPRRRRRRSTKAAGSPDEKENSEAAVAEPPHPAAESHPAAAPAAADKFEGPGSRLMRRLRPLMRWRHGEEPRPVEREHIPPPIGPAPPRPEPPEPERASQEPAEAPKAAPEAAPEAVPEATSEAAPSDSGAPKAPSPASRRRRSRSRSSRRRRPSKSSAQAKGDSPAKADKTSD